MEITGICVNIKGLTIPSFWFGEKLTPILVPIFIFASFYLRTLPSGPYISIESLCIRVVTLENYPKKSI